jgi:hypothetical protein
MALMKVIMSTGYRFALLAGGRDEITPFYPKQLEAAQRA